jgi:hypothetical protein
MKRARRTVGFAVGLDVGVAPDLTFRLPTSQPDHLPIAPVKHPVLQQVDNV